MDSFVVKLITLTAFLAGGGYVFGQTVTTGLTPQEYISDILLGSGITASNFTFTGFPEQLGHLEGFTPANFPISDGLVMSCGPTSQLIPDTGGDCTFDGFLENIGVTGEADLLSDAVFVANYYGFGSAHSYQ